MTKTQQIIAGLLKTAMHGYPDYQMDDPATPLAPQLSLPAYEPEDQEPQGLLSKVPGRAIGMGGMIGGFMGKGLVDEDLRRASQTINFLKGKPSPQLNARLLQALQSGQLTPEAIPAARQGLSSPEWLKENLFETPAAYDEALKLQRGNYWKAMGKGPGLGMLGGALAGLGGGLLYNHLKESADVSFDEVQALNNKFQALEAESKSIGAGLNAVKSQVTPGNWFSRLSTPKTILLGGGIGALGTGALMGAMHLLGNKEASLRGLLWKEARPAFMAPPPASQEIPTAWRGHLSFKQQRPSAYAATQVGPSPFEQTRMTEAPMARTMAAKTPGLLSKLHQGATMVARRRL